MSGFDFDENNTIIRRARMTAVDMNAQGDVVIAQEAVAPGEVDQVICFNSCFAAQIIKGIATVCGFNVEIR